VSVIPFIPGQREPRARLDDGRSVLIRRMTPADVPAMRAMLDLADPMDLRHRFMATSRSGSVDARRIGR
jgi:hypothetical protein